MYPITLKKYIFLLFVYRSYLLIAIHLFLYVYFVLIDFHIYKCNGGFDLSELGFLYE